VHTGGAAERPANPGRTPTKERLLDTRGQAQDGDARNVINARRTGNTETRATAGYHPRRDGRYDSREDCSPTPEPPGTRVFSREIRTASFPQRFRQPTSIDKYNGETDPRVWLNDYRLACQLGVEHAEALALDEALGANLEIVRTCEGCQFYARKSNLPAHVLQTIPVTWPFAVWGLDIVGPLLKAPGGYTHLLVAIDKFSKWVEARPITNLRAEQAVTFITDIVYRFEVPNPIITEKGAQFTGRKFLEFSDKFHIRVDWVAMAHPQTNGQVECANGMILQGLKPKIFDRLNKSGRKWLQELPAVVWSLRTTPSRATGFTPFFLVYGAEAILPTDLEYGSPRVRG
jgi:hypothetical protein